MTKEEFLLKLVKIKSKYLRPGDLIYNTHYKKIYLVIEHFNNEFDTKTKIRFFYDCKKSLPRLVDSHKEWFKIICEKD